MTREETIKILNDEEIASLVGKFHGGKEALDLAIAALRPISREQVERMRGEWQVCFEDWRKQMAGDQCSKCGFQHYGTSTHHYKFCPACGAPMTDEAVQMVMERLGALKDGSTTY